ncbi:methyltransferase [Streptomyces sp. NPDC004838]
MNRLTTSWGDFALARSPEDPRDPLRAWDAADEYLLRELSGPAPDSSGPAPGPSGSPEASASPEPSGPAPGPSGPVDLSGSLVVVGDRWGALAVSLAAHSPVQITDSFLTQEATRSNLARNGIGADSVRLLSARDAAPERIDVLLVRVPKSLALLEDQLRRLAPAVRAETVVIGAGMVSEIHTSTLRLFERFIGPTRTSRAVRKARLIFAAPDPSISPTPSPWPLRYALPEGIGTLSGRTVTNHAGIFCADRLDIGTRFFLRSLPESRGPERVVDLGCGNGVVGTAVALANPRASVIFIDESFSAVASAEATYRDNVASGEKAEFTVGDGLAGVPDGSVDLVLCNPPFHSHRATTDATARRMFGQARRALRSGGELWIVGNRHLGYHVRLRRLFGGCEVVASDPKFVVLRAVKR